MLVFRTSQALNHTVCHFSLAWFNSQNRVMSFWLALMPHVHFNETHTIVQPWAVKRHISPWHTAPCSHNSLISNCFTPDRWVHKFPHAANINTNNNKCCFKNEGLHENAYVTWLERWVAVVQSHWVLISDWQQCAFNVKRAQRPFTQESITQQRSWTTICFISPFKFAPSRVLKLSREEI